MPHFVYILNSLKDSGYYTGEISDVNKRLLCHNSGLQLSTKNRRPFEIIYIESCIDRTQALKREKEIKSWKGGIKFRQLLEGCSPATRDTTFGTSGSLVPPFAGQSSRQFVKVCADRLFAFFCQTSHNFVA